MRTCEEKLSPPGGEFGERAIRELIELRLGKKVLPGSVRILTDTTDFFRVDYGDVLLAGGRPYLIRNNEREGRFGLDDEPKFWVKRSVDLLSGEIKIIKLGFREQFQARVGGFVFDCVRSPGKEARILDLVRGHKRFMQGFAVEDSAGNNVRIIDFIRGRTLGDHLRDLPGGHDEYFFGPFAGMLDLLIELAAAVGFLHRHGEKHGDIRRDHVIIEGGPEGARWIDFDFNYSHAPNPGLYDLFGLGNLLVLIAGKGDLTLQDLERDGSAAAAGVNDGDMNIIFRNRLVNLGKVYPYIPEALTRALRHFSAGAPDYYETVDEFLDDLREVRSVMAGRA